MSSKRIYGNGNVKSEMRGAGSFNSISVSGNIDVYVKQDSVRSIKIETDENLLEYIQVINDGDIVRIHPEQGFNLDAGKGIKVYISSPVFQRLDGSGSCDIYSENKIISASMISIDLSGSCNVKMELDAPKIYADLSGSCGVQLNGATKEFSVEGSGSTDIKCMDLLAENVDVDISGSGTAEVFASVKLDIGVSGSGDVRYKGNATVNQHISGSGSVKKID